MRYAQFLIGAIVSMSALFGNASETTSNPISYNALPNGGETTVVPVYYGIGNSTVKEAGSLVRLKVIADSLYRDGSLSHVYIEGYSSPDGPLSLNMRLAYERATGIRTYLLNNSRIPAEMFSVSSKAEDWDGLRAAVDADVSFGSRDKVLMIIDSDADVTVKKSRLRKLEGGWPWLYMAKNIFPGLRRSGISLRFELKQDLQISDNKIDNTPPEFVGPESADDAEQVVSAVTVPEPVAESTVSETSDGRHWYLKTNVPAWGMLWMNVAVEFDFARHWSAQLPVYYSGFNYFTRRRKFRTFAIMPEVRWWRKNVNNGFFIGAHLGMAYYNVAFGGESRYQDHDRSTPALGGGLNLGYRLEISSNRRWLLEFSVGAGVYRLDYDIFRNEANGLLKGRETRTFFGIDNAAISIAYRFDLGRRSTSNGQKGGGR